MLKDWKGTWIDSRSKYIKKLKSKINPNQKKLDLKISKITNENINHIIGNKNIFYKKYPAEIDFFSIDIDSFDLDCLIALKITSPRCICIEYNSKFKENIKLEISKIKNFRWKYDDYFGSSLYTINKQLVKKGYKLVATNITGSNAFFVRKDLVSKCKTKKQNLKQLYSPANFDLFNYNVAHAPSNKYLIDKLNE